MKPTLQRIIFTLLFAAVVESYSADKPPAESVNPDSNLPELDTVFILGNRISLENALTIKQEHIEIVDSVTANTINKLPDYNVSDAIQRITGVQITRDRGEGSVIQIRGLTQVETLFNGREMFTAGNGRNLDYADIPAELLAGIDVYKTATPDLIEGGVGGTVNLRSHRPFDFAGREIVVNVRGAHADLADAAEPQVSGLLSDYWQSERFGKIGALVNVVYQRRAFREDQASAANPVGRNDLTAGQTVYAPNGSSETLSQGTRVRSSGNIVLQWQPNDHWDLYAEANYAEFKTTQDSYQLNLFPLSESNALSSGLPAFSAGSAKVFPGSQNLQSIDWLNASASQLSFARDTVDRTKQGAIGGSWQNHKFKLSSDLSYTDSENDLFFSGPVMSASGVNFSQNLAGTVPSSITTNNVLQDPNALKFSNLALRTRPFAGTLAAGRVDGELFFNHGLVKTISAGMRYAHRDANNEPGLIIADTAIAGLSAASLPGQSQLNPYRDFFDGQGAHSQDYLIGKLDNARDIAAIRKIFGITSNIPGSNPLGTWQIEEDTYNGYVSAKLDGVFFPIDGIIGLRIASTEQLLNGYQIQTNSNTVTPFNVNSDYIDLLPSANFRYLFSDAWHFRLGASRTLTRPDFNQLSPSLTLTANTINPAQNFGVAGNPWLAPIRSTNVDGAIDWYPNKATALSVAGFWKSVDGFVANTANPETYFGQTYLVTRPYNSNTATLQGFEFNYQQFYDFLPGAFKGLGIQANYTFIDSETFISALGQPGPLQNLSRNSFNLIGMYDYQNWSLRVAYNWRDKFLSGTANIVGIGVLPLYTEAYDWLDASLIYKVNSHLSLSIEGLNILGTVRKSYYETPERPQTAWLNDTQVIGSITLRY